MQFQNVMILVKNTALMQIKNYFICDIARQNNIKSLLLHENTIGKYTQLLFFNTYEKQTEHSQNNTVQHMGVCPILMKQPTPPLLSLSLFLHLPSLPLEVGPLNPSRGPGGQCKLSQRGLGRSLSRSRIRRGYMNCR